MNERSAQLSKEAAQLTIAPHLTLMGNAEKKRVTALINALNADGRIRLSDVLAIIYPHTISKNDYDHALMAVRQFRLRLKKFTESIEGLHFVFKSDQQTRAKPSERWCWFEGLDQTYAYLTHFSQQAIRPLKRLKYVIPQEAVIIQFDDPLPEQPRHAVYEPNEDYPHTALPAANDILNHLIDWIHQPNAPTYCALLGEYGMGKTITSMRITNYLLEERLIEPSLPLPIYLDLRNLLRKEQCWNMGLEEIISTLLTHAPADIHSASQPITAQDIIRIVRESHCVVVFDGLDEVLVHLSRTEGQRFTEQLIGMLHSSDEYRELGTSSSRIIFSCRTHYFRTIRDQKRLFTQTESLNQAEQPHHNYFLLALQPLSHAHIHDYLSHTLKHAEIQNPLTILASIHNLMEVAERPYTLQLIPSLIPNIQAWQKQGVRVTGIRIYQHIVLSWLERDSGKHRLLPEHKQQLMEHLAAELWRSGQSFWSISDIEQWFVGFLHTHPNITMHYTLGQNEARLHHIIDMLKEDLRTATFLVRKGDSHFCFAHTSLHDFFLATYLHNALKHGHIEQWRMPPVNRETLAFLAQLISEEETKQCMDALQSITQSYQAQISEMAFAYLLFAHSSDYPSPPLSGIQLDGAQLEEWTISGKWHDAPKNAPRLNLRNASFRGANLKGSHLNYLDLDECDFTGAHLQSTEFMYDSMRQTTFTHADIQESLIRKCLCEQADFSNANTAKTVWVECQLLDAAGLDFNATDILYTSCEPEDAFKQHLTDASLPSQAVVNDFILFAPDGKTLISVSWDNALRIWDIAQGTCLKTLLGHTRWVRGCDVSKNGQYIISASEDLTLRLWDSQSGECLRLFTGHSMMVRKCAFSPNDQLLISASLDGSMRLWHRDTGECLRIYRTNDQGLNDCAFSPNGEHVIAASDDGTLIIWETVSGIIVRHLVGHQGMVRSCNYSPDGQWIISGAVDKTLRLWNSQTGECVREFKGHNARIRTCVFSPDGQHIASSAEDKTVKIWNIETGVCLHTIEHQNKVRACTYSPDGMLIASSGNERTIHLWNAQTAERIKTLE